MPVYFWKIAALVKNDGGLSVSAYLLDQKELIDNLERFLPGVFQVSVEEIIERTELDFSHIAGSQVDLAATEGLERAEAGFPRHRLSQVAQILF